MQRNGDDSKERFFPEAGMSPSTHSHDASTISYRIIFSSKKTENNILLCDRKLHI